MNRHERRRQEKELAKSGAAAGDPRLAPLERRAVAAFEAGRLDEALAQARRLMALVPARADLHAFAGMVALKAGDPAAAAAHFAAAVERRPDYPEAHHNLGRARRALGDLAGAIQCFRNVAALRPDLASAHGHLADALAAAGELAGAAEAYRRALALAPAVAEARRNFGMALQRLGRLDEAEGAFARAIETKPDWPLPYANLVVLLLQQGRAGEAVEICDRWTARMPGCVQAVALTCIALNEAGAVERHRALLDFDRFVQVRDWGAPPGYDSLAAFNRALVAHVLAHPTLGVPPRDDPTYHHPNLAITQELLDGAPGPMAALETMIRAAIDDYRRTVPRAPRHIFLENWPARWQLATWATKLEGEGNLDPHIHLEGYLGGAYYPELPAIVSDAAAGEAGWFELGGALAEVPVRAPRAVRRVQPKEGRMILFPGYFSHATVPFKSPQRRISIAFDMKPAG